MSENFHQSEDGVVERFLSALQGIMNEVTGEEIPLAADMLYWEYWNLPKYGEYIDHLDFCFRIEARLGVDMLSDDGDQLLGRSIRDVDEWQERIGSKLTFRHIAVFVGDRARVTSIEPATILGIPCRPAGAFRAIAGVVSELLSSKKAFPPSAKIYEILTARDLRRIWFKLRWLSGNRLPPLRTSLLGNISDKTSLVAHALALFVFLTASVIGVSTWIVGLSATDEVLPAWPLVAIAGFALLVKSCVWQS